MAAETRCPLPGAQRHASQVAALAHLTWLKTRGAGDELSVYPCGHHWHVGPEHAAQHAAQAS